MARHSFFHSAPKPPPVPVHMPQPATTTSYQAYQPPTQPTHQQQVYQSHQIYQTYQIAQPYQLYQAYQPFQQPPSRPAHPAPGHPKSRVISGNAPAQQIQYLPYYYQVSPLSASPKQSIPSPAAVTAQSPSEPTRPAPAPPTPKRPAPPRLAPLIIPVRKSPPPIHVRPEPPRVVAQVPTQSIHAPVPQKPPVVPKKIPIRNNDAVEDDADMDFFQFQYPCMLPPMGFGQKETQMDTLTPVVEREQERISVVKRERESIAVVNTAVAAVQAVDTSSPRYSLPVLPSQSAISSSSSSSGSSASSSIRRSKPYLQSRRERMSLRIARTGTVAEKKEGEEDEWTEVMHVDSAYDGDITPLATVRPETPLEYKAEQAAALHALLGLVLEGKADVAGEDHGRAVAILEEEVELAARGFRKFSADEYVRELREVMGAFDSPC